MKLSCSQAELSWPLQKKPRLINSCQNRAKYPKTHVFFLLPKSSQIFQNMKKFFNHKNPQKYWLLKMQKNLDSWMYFVKLNCQKWKKCAQILNAICIMCRPMQGSLARGWPTALGCIGDTNGPLPRYTRLCNIHIIIQYIANHTWCLSQAPCQLKAFGSSANWVF